MFSIGQLFNQSTEFQKGLRNSSILNNQHTLNINDLKLLVQGFPQNPDSLKTPTQIRKNFDQFFKSLPAKPNFRVKMKILATCHVLLDDFVCGAQFSEALIQWDGFLNKENIPEQQKVVSTYYEIIQRFANSFALIKMSKSQKNYQLLQFLDNQQAYYKAINLLNMVFTYTEVFKKCLHSSEEEILCEVILLLWNDVIAIYLFFEKLIMAFISDYLLVNSTIFYQIFDLIPDFINLSEKIKLFYHLNDYCQDDKQFPEPQWKSFDEKIIDEMSMYKSKLKIKTARIKIQQQKNRATCSTQLMTPQHMTQTSYFSNTTFGYIKRLSTVDDPFTTHEMDDAHTKFKTLFDKR